MDELICGWEQGPIPTIILVRMGTGPIPTLTLGRMGTGTHPYLGLKLKGKNHESKN